MISDIPQAHHGSTGPDMVAFFCALGASAYAHLLGDPLSTITIAVTLFGCTVRAAINVLEFMRKLKRHR